MILTLISSVTLETLFNFPVSVASSVMGYKYISYICGGGEEVEGSG